MSLKRFQMDKRWVCIIYTKILFDSSQPKVKKLPKLYNIDLIYECVYK